MELLSWQFIEFSNHAYSHFPSDSFPPISNAQIFKGFENCFDEFLKKRLELIRSLYLFELVSRSVLLGKNLLIAPLTIWRLSTGWYPVKDKLSNRISLLVTERQERGSQVERFSG